MQFPFQFHKIKSEIAPFLHFSTLRANRKSEIGNHWVISDFWFPITPLQVHPPRLEDGTVRSSPGRDTSTRVHVYIVCCFHGLWILKAGYLFMYLFIDPSIYSSILLFISLFCYWFLYLFLSRPLYLYMYVHCTCTCISSSHIAQITDFWEFLHEYCKENFETCTKL